jgi:hypothetical protein
MNEWAMQGFQIHVENATWSTQYGSRWSLAAVWPLLREFREYNSRYYEEWNDQNSVRVCKYLYQ